MNQRDDLDRMLSAWLDDPYTPPAPRYLGEVLERTRHTRQRPAWASLERWLPMADKITRRGRPPRPLRMARLLLVAVLVLALAAVVAVVGAQLLGPKVVIPQGGAAVLVFASIVGQSGDIFTVRADGTDPRQLTSGPGAESTPTFSPDGTRIAYREWRDGKDLIVVVDAGGGHRTILATNTSSASYCTRGGSVVVAGRVESHLPGQFGVRQSIRPVHRAHGRLGTGNESCWPRASTAPMRHGRRAGRRSPSSEATRLVASACT